MYPLSVNQRPGSAVRSLPLAVYVQRPGRGFHSVAPKIDGVQTALVVGPPGEEIHTDGHGRIKIQCHWDRRGKFNDRSSPWGRTSPNKRGARL